jgi:hypothetical protein
MAFVCANRRHNDGASVVEIDHIAFGALQLGHYLDSPNELSIAKLLWQRTILGPMVTTAESLLYAR